MKVMGREIKIQISVVFLGFVALCNGFCSEVLTSLEILFPTSVGSDLQKKEVPFEDI